MPTKRSPPVKQEEFRVRLPALGQCPLYGIAIREAVARGNAAEMKKSPPPARKHLTEVQSALDKLNAAIGTWRLIVRKQLSATLNSDSSSPTRGRDSCQHVNQPRKSQRENVGQTSRTLKTDRCPLCSTHLQRRRAATRRR